MYKCIDIKRGSHIPLYGVLINSESFSIFQFYLFSVEFLLNSKFPLLFFSKRSIMARLEQRRKVCESVLRRRTRNRGRRASLFPRFSLRSKYKNIRISSPFYFGRGYAIIFSFMPWTLCTSFGFFKLGSPFECGMAPSPQVPQSFLHRFVLYCLISVIDKVNIFVYSNKTPW